MTDVRAITVRQPWAWAIAHGGKSIENRSRGTSYRGRLLIHAGFAWSERGAHDPRVSGAWDAIAAASPALIAGLQTRGAVVAVAELVDVHPDAGCCRPWGESSYEEGAGRIRTTVHHLVLEDVIPLAEPVECLGALGLWRPPAEVLAAALDGDVDMASLRPRTS